MSRKRSYENFKPETNTKQSGKSRRQAYLEANSQKIAKRFW